MENMNKNNGPEFEVCRYLDGELSPGEEFAFEQRMVEDSALRKLVEKYHHVDSLVGQLGAEVMDIDEPQQRDEILAAVDLLIHNRRRRFQRLILRPVIGVCAAAAIFVIGVCLYLIITAPPQQHKKPGESPLSDASSEIISRCVVAYHVPQLQSSNAEVRMSMMHPPASDAGESLVYSRTIRTKAAPISPSVVWAGFSGGGVIAAFTTASIIDEPILPGIFGYLTY